ncbi:MAG TPA: S8 family serine peptidase [Candidatus Methanoperedens sp.]
MKKLRSILIIFLVIASMVLQVSASSERDVIIVYNQKPGHVDKEEVTTNGGNIRHTYQIIPAISTRLSEEAIKEMKKNPRIAYIENDKIYQAAVDEYDSSWGVNHIGSKIVQDNNINGTGVKIAVLDTGIDYNHEELRDNYKGGYNFVFNNSDPFDDYNTYIGGKSHGTHVAGIIAAKRNGMGVVGVAPNASIYAVKVLDGAGIGMESWLISGIEWAVNNKMDIISMSLGGGQDEPDSIALKTAVDNAYNAGVLLVASAGNTYGGNVTQPARYDSVISVTATDEKDNAASFSAKGPQIELAAPGVNITSTIVGGYDTKGGTSMAAPHVTGTAALIMSGNNLEDLNGDGLVNNKDIRLQLQRTAKDLGDQGKDNTYGYGLVDAQAAALGTEIPETMSFDITRSPGNPAVNTKNVSLSDGQYEITIKNFGQLGVKVDVFEHGIKRSDLSSNYKFNSALKEVIFDLDARGTTFDVTFTPYGNPGTPAEINIQRKG